MTETRDGVFGVTDIPDDPTEQLSVLEREAQAWVTKFALGQATEADLQALKRWHSRSAAHAEAFAKANRLWATLGPAGQQYLAQAGRRFQSLTFSVRRNVGRRAFLGGALAASAAAAGYLVIRPPFDLWPSLSQFSADYQTATGERKAVALADGVSVEMNAKTSIAVRPQTGAASQIELISGEAAVTTPARGAQTFIVIAGQGRTVARQASFDVRYIRDKVCVSCLEGDVRVEHGTSARALRDGQQVVYAGQRISSVRGVDSKVVTAWREGVLVFQETPLAEAIEDVNRYRPGKILLANQDLGRRLFNARFRIENVEDVIGQIQQVFGAKVTAFPGGIVVLS